MRIKISNCEAPSITAQAITTAIWASSIHQNHFSPFIRQPQQLDLAESANRELLLHPLFNIFDGSDSHR